MGKRDNRGAKRKRTTNKWDVEPKTARRSGRSNKSKSNNNNSNSSYVVITSSGRTPNESSSKRREETGIKIDDGRKKQATDNLVKEADDMSVSNSEEGSRSGAADPDNTDMNMPEKGRRSDEEQQQTGKYASARDQKVRADAAFNGEGRKSRRGKTPNLGFPSSILAPDDDSLSRFAFGGESARVTFETIAAPPANSNLVQNSQNPASATTLCETNLAGPSQLSQRWVPPSNTQKREATVENPPARGNNNALAPQPDTLNTTTASVEKPPAEGSNNAPAPQPHTRKTLPSTGEGQNYFNEQKQPLDHAGDSSKAPGKETVVPSSGDTEGQAQQGARGTIKQKEVKQVEDQSNKKTPLSSQQSARCNQLTEKPTFKNVLFLKGIQNWDPEVVTTAAVGLWNLLKDDETDLEIFVALGGHSILVTMMEKWSSQERIQYNLIRCLSRFTENYTGRVDIFSALLHMGCLELLCVAMRNFKVSADIQCFCMGSIGSLLFPRVNHKRVDNKASVRFVDELEGIPSVCKVMKTFPDDVEIQHYACRLLDKLCKAGLQERPCMKDEALGTVSSAIQRFPNNTSMCKYALSYMKAVLKVIDDEDE